jgi:pimeloyl-ACP methyl ester carboxylesterase
VCHSGEQYSTEAMTHSFAQETPPMIQEMLKARAALAAQCPTVDRPANAVELPIHMTTWGNTGPLVLFVHGGVQGGIGGGPGNFTGQQPLSEQGWQLKVPDRPGFGESPSRGPDDMVADSVWISKEIGESGHLVGHSFGGAAVLLAAALNPKAVRSLTLIEPALQPMLSTDPESMKNPVVQSALQIVTQFYFTAHTPAEFALFFAKSLGQGEQGGENPSAAALEAHPERATSLGCAVLNANVATPAAMRHAADIVAEAHIPVLVVSGGYSPAQDATGEIVAKLTRGKHVIVKAPNHFVSQSNPSEFNSVLAAFLHSADDKSSAPR